MFLRVNDERSSTVIRAGDTIQNPVTGERLVFRKTAAETNGEAVVLELLRPSPRGRRGRACPPGPERSASRSLEGEVAFKLEARRPLARAGRPVQPSPAGMSHRFWNAGAEEAHFVCEIRPALQFEQLIETMFALAARRQDEPEGNAQPVRLAVIARHHFQDVRLPFPPALDAAGRAGAGGAARPALRLPANVCRSRSR